MEILYPNLPGVYLEKVDGKLVLTPEGRNHVVAVFGTADSGPSYFPSVVKDFSHATQLFGSYGTGIQGIFEVMQGNPETIALIRIGGTQTELVLGGGLVKVKFRDYGPDVMSYYGLFISDTTNEFKIFDITKKNTDGSYVLVYSNLYSDYETVMSKTDVEVEVKNDDWNAFFAAYSADHTGDFGSESNPISIYDIYNTVQESDPFFAVIPGLKGSDDMKLTNMKLMEGMLKGFFAASSFSLDQVFVPGAYLDAPNVADDEKARIYHIDDDGSTWDDGDTLTVQIGSDYVWTVTAESGDSTVDLFNKIQSLIASSVFFNANVDASGSPAYLEISGKPGYDFATPIATIHDVSAGSDTTLTVTSTQSPFDNRYIEAVTDATCIPVVETVSGSAPTSLVWKFTDPAFIKGTEVLTWNTSGNPVGNYEIVVSGDTVYIILESVTTTDADDFLKISYVRTLYDALPYFHWEEVEGELQIEWSYVKTLDNKYHEANFAYEIARFCHELSVNFKECLGVVGVRPPKSLSARDISRWIGTLPQTDEFGQIVSNGTGLLGYKYLAGTTDTSPGFFYTDSRYMDGIPVQDRDGSPIDIGKYLSVVVGWALMRNNYKGKPYPYFASCEGVFAAVDEMLPVNKSMTNEVLPACVVPYRLSKNQINDLTGIGYTVVEQDVNRNAAVVVDSPTIANPNSDYQRRQTVKIFKYLNEGLRAIMKPYIGGPMNTLVIESQKSQVQELFDDAMKRGIIQSYDFRIKATPRMQILNYEEIHYKVQPAFELKQVFGYAAMQVPTSDLQAAASK